MADPALASLRARVESARQHGEWDVPLGSMAIGCDEVIALVDRVAAMETAGAALLAALDAHEDAVDPLFGDAYHRDRADAIYEAKVALRDAIEGRVTGG